MRRSLRLELRFLRVYAITSSLVLLVLCTAAFRQGTVTGKFDEITVGRMNVVDADGTLRLVISNKDRMHPGMMDGKTIDRARPEAGLLFFNEVGDEVGGLTFTGQEVNGRGRANAGIMFDQFKQDQTIGISYSETDGRRTAGLQVWDRPDTRLSELIEKLNAANRIADPAEKGKAMAAIRAAAPPAPRRLFAGKLPDRSATVSLSDAAGKPRLTLTVDADGNPRIEFLDQQGKVVSRLPQKY
ncbi:MAG: hypothetical protein M3545_03695 [Acidobacteriota bacterium]|nr:hypothetical protein [Acidobacteriota bacterium]MDQ3347051.1 hypothetical protein [Acidobacteriota bacterium]MDQ3419967.1 hypothetical protein [Acidobacteriota bacterium]